MKLALSAGALALSMALAGCGGGGSNSQTRAPSSESGGTTTTTEPTTAQAIDDATAKVKAYGDAVAAITETATSDGTTADDERRAAVAALEAAEDAGATTAQLRAARADLGTHDRALGAKREKIAAAKVAQTATDTANAKDRTDKAKALRTALASGNIVTSRAAATAGNAFVSNGDNPRITIRGSGDEETDVTVYLTEKTTVNPLGDWKGTHYEGKQGTGDAAQTGMVRAYSNRDDPVMEDFASDEAGDAREGLDEVVTTPGPLQGTFPIDIDGTDAVYSRHIASAGFATSGTDTHTGATANIDGTYKGAAGKFICSSGSACTSQYDEDTGNIILTGAWHFAPASGAKLPVEKDNDYLQFGWWKLENSKDEATATRVFARAMGVADDATSYTLVNVRAGGITGKATYNGKAAGLFAVSGDLRSTIADRSGGFTADATLNAEFSGNDSTLTGTIDKFTLDDGGSSVDWSIELQKLTVNDGNASPADVVAGRFDSRYPAGGSVSADTSRTMWSIDKVKDQANSGHWAASVYDAPAAEADGNNRPDAVIGIFHSTYGNTHRLRGGFAAER